MLLKSIFNIREVLAKQEFPVDLYGPPRVINPMYGPAPMYGPFGPTPPLPPSPSKIILTTVGIILGLAIPILGVILFLKRKFIRHKNASKNPQNRHS